MYIYVYIWKKCMEITAGTESSYSHTDEYICIRLSCFTGIAIQSLGRYLWSIPDIEL